MMPTQQEITIFKQDVTQNVDNQNKRASIKRVKIGGFYRTLADWIAEMSANITGIIKITTAELEDDNKSYVAPTLKGQQYYLWLSNIQTFLIPGTETFSVLPDGGFELKYPLPDDAYILLFGGTLSGSGGSNVELYNGLDQTVTGKALDAVQGKVLYDMIANIDGSAFQIVTPDSDGHLEIDNHLMNKVILNRDITIGALEALPGMKGTIILVQDDMGGHLTKLSTGNKGPSIVLNTLPRSVTQLTFIRTDTDVYWESKVLESGIQVTQVPVIRIDDFNDTFEILHSFNDSDILVSVEDGPWIEYGGLINIPAEDRPAGFWKAKVKGTENRIESAVVSSKPTFAAKTGFNYIFNFNLS